MKFWPFRERLDYGAIFAADDHLRRALDNRRFDREHGDRNAAEWRKFLDELEALPHDLSQNERARAVLKIKVPR